DAVIYPELGLRWTFRELEELAQECARGLAALGIQKGERVALWSTNLPEWVVLFFGLAKIGAVMVTVNTLLRKHEVEYLLSQSQSCAVMLSQGFRDVDYPETLCQIVPELRGRRTGISLRSAKLPFLRHAIFLGDSAPAGMIPFKQVQETGKQAANEHFAWPSL